MSFEIGDRVTCANCIGPTSHDRRGYITRRPNDVHMTVRWDDGEERLIWVGFLRKLSILELIAEAAQ